MDNSFIQSLSGKQKITFLISHYFTFLLIILLLAYSILSSDSYLLKTAIVLFTVYLLPPILARIVLKLFPIRRTHIPISSKEFTTWWFIFSTQTIFLRFPFLEEVLRSIPGLYSAWLRLWGSKIGKMTYWAAGTTILDRSFLSIGDNLMLGAGVRLNPHVIITEENGERTLLLAPVTVGSNCLIGGYSLLTAGTTLSDDESTKAFLISPPFSKWKAGKRVQE